NGWLAAAHVARAGLALVWVIAIVRLERLATTERLPVRMILCGALFVLAGESMGMVAVLVAHSGAAFLSSSIALTTTGLLLNVVALLHPAVAFEPPFVRTVPTRMGITRLTVVVVAVLVVPGLTLWSVVA